MEEKKYSDIELRSEEVQEVMNRIPPAILRYGITVLLVIIATLLIVSAFFSYPDSIDTEFVLTTQTPPAYVIAKTSGRIEDIYVHNKQSVHRGNILGIIENVASTEDMLFLREKLQEWEKMGSRIEMVGDIFFHSIPELGNVQPYYSTCLLTWNNYMQHMQEAQSYETEVSNSVASLINAISEWEKSYMLTSPIDGKVAFLQLWTKNQNVVLNDNIFVVVPTGIAEPVGKALLPMNGSGKVEVGQRVIIRLPAFPEQEYGFIHGKVRSISPVPDSENRYVVEISLPDGLKTTYGKELPLVKTMSGTATIVTKEKMLLRQLLNI